MAHAIGDNQSISPHGELLHSAKRSVCPFCNGAKQIKVANPSGGEEVKCLCPQCSGGQPGTESALITKGR